jgi:hypothetical protein
MLRRRNVTGFTDYYFNLNSIITSRPVTGAIFAAAVIMVEAATAVEFSSV